MLPERFVPVGVCLAAFLLGSIPFGMLLAKLAHGGDLRLKGSGNIGATNVSRVLGFWPWGLLTFALDFLKGALPVFLSASQLSQLTLPELWAIALCGVLGHCFSPWLKFRGGKGVATGFGALLVLSPGAAALGAAGFALAFAATRTGSLSSLCGILIFATSHLVLESPGAYLWIGALLLFVILVRHETNLDALLQSRETTFG